jgi:hypothetical protein
MMRSFLWITALVASAGLAAQPASAAAAARTWDLVTYTAPNGFKVVEKKGTVERLAKVSANSYCTVDIYTSMPASSDLEASFAAKWEAVARRIAVVDAPEPATRNVGNTRAAVGSATSTFGGGQPVWLMLIVLDAGARVLPIIVMTPNEDEFEVCKAEVERMLSGLVVKRVERTEDASAGVVAAEPQTTDGELVIPAPTRTITVADLAGEWVEDGGITRQIYETRIEALENLMEELEGRREIAVRDVDRYTGTYAGSESLQHTVKYAITKQGEIFSDFFAIQNGKKISEKSAGTVTLAGGVLVIKKGSTTRYVLRGWLETPEVTIMKLNGPWYDDPIPENIFTDPHQGWNLDEHWVRKK